MSSANVTNFASFVKTVWPDGFADILYKNFPVLGLIEKDSNWEGDNMVLPIRYGTVTGASVSFQIAQKNKSPSAVTRFTVPFTKEYVVLSVDGQLLRAAATKKGGFASIVTSEIESGMLTFKRRLAQGIYGNGGGAFAQFNGGSVAGTNLTVTNRTDMVHAQKNMSVQLSSDDGFTGSAGVRTGTLTVAGVNRQTSTITFTGNINAGVPAATNADFLYWEGDYQGKIKGQAAWVPTTAPGATLFYGVDRTADTTRLGGLRVSAAATIEETLIDMSAECFIEGADPDVALVNPLDWAKCAKSMGSKAIIDIPTDSPSISFKGLQLYTPQGVLKLVGDPFMAKGFCRMLQTDTWHLGSLGDFPGILMEDTNKMLRDMNEDAYEIRIGGYAAHGCDAPGWNAVGTLPA